MAYYSANDSEVVLNSLQDEVDNAKQQGELQLLSGESKDSYGTLKKIGSRLSTDSIIDDLSKYQTSIYAAKVNRPSFYRKEKKKKKWTPHNILRILAGIPFAILYGGALYLMVRFIFLDQPEEVIPSPSNATNASGDNVIDLATNVNYNETHTKHILSVPKSGLNLGKHRPEVIYGSIGFTVIVGTVSVFSRGTRTSMLLMLPCLITGRSRAVLFTFITGLLVDGPVAGIVHNFNEISKNTACVYDAVSRMAQSSLLKLNAVFRFIALLRSQALDPFDIGASSRPKKTEPQQATATTNLTFPRVTALKEQIAWMKDGVNELNKYTAIIRKFLTALSMLLMIFDAIMYLRSYYSDNSFDNKYINRNVRHVWKSKGHAKLLPLRHWEVNEGYKSSSLIIKFKKREVKALLRRTIPTLLFAFFIVVIIFADYLLAKVVQSMKDEEDVIISLDGVEDGLAQSVKYILQRFHDTTKFCGVRPVITSVNSYVLICVFLFVAVISCFFEVLISRLRARMCNLFYTDRAHERADYLHFRITAGRVNRRTQMMLIIKSQLEKERRLKEFSPVAKLKMFIERKCCSNRKRKTILCPGCEWDVKFEESVLVKYTLGDTKIKERICLDCNNDFRPISFHPNSQYFSTSPKTFNVNEHYFNKEFENEFLDEVYKSV